MKIKKQLLFIFSLAVFYSANTIGSWSKAVNVLKVTALGSCSYAACKVGTAFNNPNQVFDEVIQNPDNIKCVTEAIHRIINTNHQIQQLNTSMRRSSESFSAVQGAALTATSIMIGYGVFHRQMIIKMVKDIIIHRDFFGNHSKKGEK